MAASATLISKKSWPHTEGLSSRQGGKKHLLRVINSDLETKP